MLPLIAAFILQAPTTQAPSQAAWSATTIEAASKPENKEILAEAKPATVTGEVIDLSCYTQLGKKGAAHKDCGTKCVAHGSPAGILAADGSVYMLMPEQHHPRRDGQLSYADHWSKQMGATVTVTGMLSRKGGINTLFVETPATLEAPKK